MLFRTLVSGTGFSGQMKQENDGYAEKSTIPTAIHDLVYVG